MCPWSSRSREQTEQQKSQEGPAPSSRSRMTESGGSARHTPPVPTDDVTPAPSGKPNWAEEGGSSWGGQTSAGPYQVKPTWWSQQALTLHPSLLLWQQPGTSFEGHLKCFLDDSLPGAFACMQGRRPGHGGPREQPSPPPGSLLGQGPYSYYRQVHGEGVQDTKGQHLPSGGWHKWDPGRDFLKCRQPLIPLLIHTV